ncbi:hypothetical protein B0H10DRAFT_1949459 [Mycena sp. CBHHK59/15]|nr:hypothetical protein B0H10DRAFT_1949459 [Mycena sp. CBHHK59/15]
MRDAFVIDGSPEGCFELPLSAFFRSVVDLQDIDCQKRYGIPAPEIIKGVLNPEKNSKLEPWTQPTTNLWRLKGKGHRVHSVPLWTYCDDTSGNVSKKWNKHSSVLLTLAGLPREYTQMLYNVHFIATSNISPPLEMMEAVSSMLQEAQNEGIEVWDCVYKEYILVIPWFLAFQGDNLMSSEFASHIGMKGNYFCRVCHATSDKKECPPGAAGEISRIKEFTTAGKPRTKKDTIGDLESQLKRVLDGAKSSWRYGNRYGDSPVEILHIVLLGVVKYWWQDAVSRQNTKAPFGCRYFAALNFGALRPTSALGPSERLNVSQLFKPIRPGKCYGYGLPIGCSMVWTALEPSHVYRGAVSYPAAVMRFIDLSSGILIEYREK